MSAHCLLFFLHVLLLLDVSLLQLLCLLLVPLLYLLPSRPIGVLARHLLVILFLPLLESLPLLILSHKQLLLLLLVFPIHGCVSTIWRSQAFSRWKVVGMDHVTRTRYIVRRTRNRRTFKTIDGSISRPCLLGWYYSALVKCSRPGSCSDPWLAVVY